MIVVGDGSVKVDAKLVFVIVFIPEVVIVAVLVIVVVCVVLVVVGFVVVVVRQEFEIEHN